MMVVAVLDTAVLYPVGLADTLLRVAAAGLYQPVWSPDILAELRWTVLDDIPDARIDKRITDMNWAKLVCDELVTTSNDGSAVLTLINSTTSAGRGGLGQLRRN